MKLGKKTHYAVVSLIYLAHDNKNNTVVSLANISTTQGISLVYLEKLFVSLRNAGIVQSIRGPGGGYKLNKSSKDISVWDIGLAVGEVFSASQCDKCSGDNCLNHAHTEDHTSAHHECTREELPAKDSENNTLEMCTTYELWNGLENAMKDYLTSISLDSLVSL